MVPLSPEAGQTSQQAGTALWFKAKAIFFLILIYVKIYASHQSEDSELWALTANSGDQADGDEATFP